MPDNKQNLPFLHELAETLLQEHNGDLSRMCLVFPNRRSGLFFRKYLGQLIEKPVWSPAIYSMPQFMASLQRNLVVPETLQLVFELYHVFEKHLPGYNRDFESFYFWGQLLLNDFSEIDKQLIEPGAIFMNLAEQKEIDLTFLDYLTDEQIDFIQRFWKNFEANTSGHQENFLKLWKSLPVIYNELKATLAARNLAWEGALYKEAAGAGAGTIAKKYSHIVFAGLSQVSKSEQKLINTLVEGNIASLYWDVDAYYLDDTVQEAGYLFRRYRRTMASNHSQAPVSNIASFPPQRSVGRDQEFEETTTTSLSKEEEIVPKASGISHSLTSLPFGTPSNDAFETSHHFSLHPARNFKHRGNLHINTLAVPQRVGQARAIEDILTELGVIDSQGTPFPDVDLAKTVIVLPEKNMLFPVLHSLPAGLKPINVTMGYPFSNTPLYTLLMHLAELQLTVVPAKGTRPALYNHIHVVAILQHPYVLSRNQAEVNLVLNTIKANANALVNQNTLTGITGIDLLELIFCHAQTVDDLFNYLFAIIADLSREVEESTGLQTVEKEYLFLAFTELRRLHDIYLKGGVIIQTDTFWKLLKQVLSGMSMPFTGEPLGGLQIMGLLESVNLDFENVIVLTANEATLPAAWSSQSFIPYNLRKAYGLPSDTEHDSAWAYYFYRLLHKAGKVYLVYNSDTGSDSGAETSRFIKQLVFESGLPIRQRVLTQQGRLQPVKPITIPKSAAIIESLLRFTSEAGDAAGRLSPSAINTYIDCSLKFYFRYIAKLQEPQEFKDELDAGDFGNILHGVIEELYKTQINLQDNATITAASFELMEGQVQPQVRMAVMNRLGISPEYHKNEEHPLTGRNLIIEQVVIRYVNRILELDKAYAPFQMLELEGNEFVIKVPVVLNGQPANVSVGGTIDRIDYKAGTMRILDYKTGSDGVSAQDIPSLFNGGTKNRSKAVFQVMLYTVLAEALAGNYPGAQLVPGILKMKSIFKGFDEDEGYKVSIGRQAVNDAALLHPSFKNEMASLLQSLYDNNTPFTQTSDAAKCTYCPYTGICHRD